MANPNAFIDKLNKNVGSVGFDPGASEEASGDATTATAKKGAAKGLKASADAFSLDGIVDSASKVAAAQVSARGSEAAADDAVATAEDAVAADLWRSVKSFVAESAVADPTVSGLSVADDVLADVSVAALAAAAADPMGVAYGAGGKPVNAPEDMPDNANLGEAKENDGGDNGNDGVGNPDPGGNGNGTGEGNPDPGGNGNGTGEGNPDPGGNGNGTGEGNPDPGGNGNGTGDGNPDAPGDGDGEGNAGRPDWAGGGEGDGEGPQHEDNPGHFGKGDGDGDADRPDEAPTPPDVSLLDLWQPDGLWRSEKYIFNLDDITGDFFGNTYGNDNAAEDETQPYGGPILQFVETRDGVDWYAIDSAFGFDVYDFIGATEKERDGVYNEGFAAALPDGSGIMISDARTDTFSTPARLGTWLEGIGGNFVKASTEHYSVMQAILSDQAFPGDDSGFYQLDDDLRLIDYVLDDDLMPILDNEGHLQEDVLNGFYVKEMVTALENAAGRDGTEIDPLSGDGNPETNIDFDRDGIYDVYDAYMTDIEIDGVMVNVAAVDIGNDGTIDFYDSNLNGFGVFGLADVLDPNESTVLEDIAYGDDYSVTLKDDGKLLYRWGNAIKRPNDVRIDAKIDLPTEWSTDDDGDGYLPLYHITAAEFIVNHTVTNNPNDQIRPEDFENEAAIGQLPEYLVVRDPFDSDNTLWVSAKDVYAGDGTLLSSYLMLTESGDILDDPTYDGTEVRYVDGTLAGYLNEDADGNAIGTVLRDFSLIEDASDSTLAAIDGMSSDLTGGFTEAWYTTMDREPFEADFIYDDEGNPIAYDTSGPRWRLQTDKFGQDLPSVVIPQDPSDPPPVSNGEEKYEVGAYTTTVLNLLDWNGTSPLALSTGWMSNSGDVSVNGVNMTDAFDVAFYVKGDIKPVTLYDAQLLMTYEEVPIAALGASVEGTGGADVLAGFGDNFFHLGIGDGETDIVVLSYGADIVDDVWDNGVEGFALDEDALGLIGFDLDADNYNVHITQELVNEDKDLQLSLDGHDVATLYGVTEFLEADDFYFA